MAHTETLPETAPETATDWLSPLEQKVRAAAERIQALKQENATLHHRIEDLEGQLAAAAAPAPDEDAARWQEERREIRERVERLTRTLEELAEV